MPRSWHSATEYFICRSTGLPQMSHRVTRLGFWVPQFGQETTSSCGWAVTIRLPQLRQSIRRCSRPFRRPHLHSQFPIEYLTNCSSQAPRKSENGKTLVKTDCSPESSRSSGSRFICRNRSYDRRCTSIRLGRSIKERIFEKFFRSAETATSVIRRDSIKRDGRFAPPQLRTTERTGGPTGHT